MQDATPVAWAWGRIQSSIWAVLWAVFPPPAPDILRACEELITRPHLPRGLMGGDMDLSLLFVFRWWMVLILSIFFSLFLCLIFYSTAKCVLHYRILETHCGYLKRWEEDRILFFSGFRTMRCHCPPPRQKGGEKSFELYLQKVRSRIWCTNR